MMLEDDLRATLRERAAEPSVRPDLLTAVRGGIRRSNRRWAAALGAAAALVAAIAVPVALRESPAPPPPAGPPAWGPPRVAPMPFPLTPGVAPAGLGRPFAGQKGPAALLTYEDVTRGVLSVEVGPEPGSWEAEGDGNDRQVMVGGRPATVRTVGAGVFDGARQGDQYVGVRWQLTDGRWVQVISTGPLGQAEVLQFVRGLRPEPLPGSPAPFTVAAAPPGLSLQFLTEGYLCLAPAAALTDQTSGRGICLDVNPGTAEPEPEDERVTVAGRAATMAVSDEGPLALTMQLDGRRVLAIDVTREDVPLTREELIRFAAGVTVA
jgi:hypothetical protein